MQIIVSVAGDLLRCLMKKMNVGYKKYYKTAQVTKLIDNVSQRSEGCDLEQEGILDNLEEPESAGGYLSVG
ncbi:unnamed protein product [Parnassius mnemosyne]|uniref:Uncharacterized protein n=1 Tax=Parnassius mnemosyne TaxID=213953 RepID=A0AAV1KL49_9NEOP